MVLAIKKKTLIIVVLLTLVFCIGLSGYSTLKTGTSPHAEHTIVIDAGHGARDGGSVGVNGTIEKEINLKYALALQKKLENAGFNVVMTRTDDSPLYDENAPNKKLSDMNARMKTIKKANPSLVVSIHMNSFGSSSVKGANTYYRENDESSKTCADFIQRSLATYCNATNKLGKPGDYYMVKCSYYTSVLVECGFLSNPEEEANLNNPEFMEKIVYSIYCGIQLYFGNFNNAI